MTCAECGAVANGVAAGWRGYRADEPEDDELEVAFYCSQCAEREFGNTSDA